MTLESQDKKPYKPLSSCCGVPLVLSVSTKWGRRIICSHCGKPKDNKVDTSAQDNKTKDFLGPLLGV